GAGARRRGRRPPADRSRCRRRTAHGVPGRARRRRRRSGARSGQRSRDDDRAAAAAFDLEARAEHPSDDLRRDGVERRRLVERAIDRRAVDGGGATEQRQRGGTAQGDDLPHGEREEGLEYLRDDCDPSCDLAPRERPEVAAVEADITGPLDEESRQRAQQRRLPGSVRADQAHDLARADADVAVVEHFAVAVSGDDRACRERGHTSIRRRWRSRRPRKNGPPTSPVTTPTGSSAGESTVRAPMSARTSVTAPRRKLAGTSRACAAPRTGRIAWGTTRPTKPITPASATAAPVSSAVTARIAAVERSRSTPRVAAVSSPRAN